MQKVVITVLGTDGPGIVAAVSGVLLAYGCNIENASQTVLQNAFAGIFIVSMPEQVQGQAVAEDLRSLLEPRGLYALLKPLESPPARRSPPPSEPFVVTTTGPDRTGLVAGITEVMARFQVNITNLKAVHRREGASGFIFTTFYEVDIPVDIDRQAFRQALRERAQSLGLDLSLQHRDIFEAMHRL